ncbi:RNB domain-containing ribonuclease [Candidatus Thiosymbion oneisti]|uniref:RNB domain-containing ribonuclease n=1 Tax=Candidatus Thiosymbion oneisti TaxID=589554 RepID=UPI000B7EF321|nr:RNB domain-containing ribonuclease [Candidatus Thiosymbion oneisti]
MAQDQATLRPDSLVLYKVRPARVLALGDKIDIELEGGQLKRVRPKDVRLLHPGPLHSLADLGPREGELAETRELLEGNETNLGELAELMFGEFSPATAWTAWQLVAEGLYFEGTPEAVRVRTHQEVAHDQAEREAKTAAERSWNEFLERLRQARPTPQDGERLQEVVRLARGETAGSRILRALGYQETVQNAHRALIRIGYWSQDYNPYPERNRLPVADPDLPVPDLSHEERLDLTQLPAYAIDDEGNQDPDDALSLDGDRIWVHVADVAALVAPDSDPDREARARGANQYLPERTVKILPQAVTEHLGLGLHPVSPALSFGFRCGEAGELTDIEIRATWVRVERLTYETVEQRLTEPPFAQLNVLAERFRTRRTAQNAAAIELPEVSVRVRDGEVNIRPLPRLCSRLLVTDTMLMAGEAAAGFCLEREIPIPFATQAAPDKVEQPADLAAMYAYRRRFKPTRLTGNPEPHFGLGLARYTRATSPLRRYSDLLVHQQIRAWLAGSQLLDTQQVTKRTAEAEIAAATVRRAERLSNQHWKLVYLRANSRWRGEGVLVDKGERKAVVLIPELAMEARVRLRGDPELNSRVRLIPQEVDLPDLTCYFRVHE